MKFLTNTISIVTELIIFVLSLIWYLNGHEIEPLIGIVASISAFLLGIIGKLSSRPKIYLHRESIIWGRSPEGYTKNNPNIIRLGIDDPEQYWRLNWSHDLEIRNNSSFTAYNIRIEYINQPLRTTIEGNIGKIEPIQPHEVRKFKIRFIQNVVGTAQEADKYLDENASLLTKKFLIEFRYNDEGGIRFRTRYNWTDDTNSLLIF